MIPETLRKSMIRQNYKLVGNHSAVKLCHWLKRSMRNAGFCYKQKFYGIESHRCLQMTPWIDCVNKCVFCWRSVEKIKIKPEEIDNPKEIINGCIKAQRLLLTGFKGWEGTNLKKWKESQKPKNVAISLVGEPTMYPSLSGLIEELHKKHMTTFLVTNGQFSDVLENITEPTQLYISLDAPSKEIYKKTDRPSFSDFWERLNKSLEAMNSLSCRKVIRLTMVKGLNMIYPEKYAELIKKASPDFIEIKGYVHVGESQKRLPRTAMPSHQDIKQFAEKISKNSSYAYKDEQEASRVVLLGK